MTQDIKKIVADNITYLRKARGMTQLELANLMNYSDKAISKWERGESTPDVDSLAKLADYFEINVEFFFHKNSPEFIEQYSTSKANKTRRIIIMFMSCVAVLLLPLIVYAAMQYIDSPNVKDCWLGFLYALPFVAAIVARFLDKEKKFIGPLIAYSCIIWLALTAVYCSILVFKGISLWMLFILGVPIEAVTVLARIMRRLGKDK